MFNEYQQQVRKIMTASGDFDAAERLIGASDLDSDQKAALWLYIWSLQSIAQRRKRSSRLNAARNRRSLASE